MCDWRDDNVFPPYATWKALVWSRISSRKDLDWAGVVSSNPKLDLFASSFSECGAAGVWSSVFAFPDLRKKKSLQLRLLVDSS